MQSQNHLNSAGTEPNNDYLQATPFIKGVSEFGMLDDDIDWWSFNLNINENISITTKEFSSLECNFTMFRSDGVTKIGTNETGDITSHLYLENAPYSGIYYLKVERISNTGNYLINSRDYQDDPYEENDIISEAHTIQDDEELGILYLYDDDYFKIYLEPDWNLTISCIYSEFAELAYEIIDIDGSTILNSTPESNDYGNGYIYTTMVFETITQPDYYYIHISSSFGKTFYDLDTHIGGNPLNAPTLTGVRIETSFDDGRIYVDYDIDSEATIGYVYRSLSYISDISGMNPIGSTTNSFQYIDYTPADGNYYYVIVAGNGKENSTISNCLNATTKRESFLKPLLSSFNPNPDLNGDFYVDWFDPSGVMDLEYYVFRDTQEITDISQMQPIAQTDVSYYEEIDMAENTYYYVIVSTNGTHNSSISDCKSVTVSYIPPAAPELDPINPNPDIDGDITIEWNWQYDVDFTYIFRDTSEITSVAGMTPIGYTTGTDDDYNDYGLGEDTYYYALIAENIHGNSSISNCENVSIEYNVPESPFLHEMGSELDDDGFIQLSWDSQGEVDSFHLFREESNITDLTSLTPIKKYIYGGDNSFEDYVTENKTYYYVLIAENLNGNSTKSNCVNITTEIIPVVNYTMYINSSFQWVDISDGIELNLFNSDYSTQVMQFEFPFYNRNFSSVRVSSNGYLRFGNNAYAFFNEGFPSNNDDSSFVISPYCTNLDPTYSIQGARIYIQSTEDYFIASWINISRWEETTPAGTFQVIIWKSGDIQINYANILSSDTVYTAGLNYRDGKSGNNFHDLDENTRNLSLLFKRQVPVDNELPVLIPLNDATYDFNSTIPHLSWEVEDSTVFNQTYELYLDNLLQNNDLFNIPDFWLSTIPISVDLSLLTIGLHNFTIKVFDGYGSMVDDEVWINIINSPPDINNLTDTTLNYGESTTLLWEIVDNYYPNCNFSIYRDDLLLTTGTWQFSPFDVTYFIDALSAGTFNYSIKVEDGAGGNNTDSLILTILPNSTPVLSDPVIIENNDGNAEKITWIVSDLDYNSSATYNLYQNGTLLRSNIWYSGDSIELDLGVYSYGSYEFRLEIDDGYGLSTEDTLIIELTNISTTPENGKDDGSNNDSLYIIIGAGTVGFLSVSALIIMIKKKGV